MSRRLEPPQRPFVRMPWRWLWGSPVLWSVWACIGLALAALGRVGRALGEAEAVRVRVEAALAATVADEAVVRLAQGDACAPGTRTRLSVGGVRVDVTWQADRFEIEVATDSARHRFSCPRLQGPAPEAFGRSLTAACNAELPPGLTVVRELLPLPPQPRDAASGVHPALQRDSSLALLRLVAGTERDDYRLGDESSRVVRLAGVDGGVIHVPGHLWVDSGASDLTLELDSDLTMVIAGNLYLGRSVRVRGGRLCLVTLPVGGQPYRDADGNGRCSASERRCSERSAPGALEGAGNAWFGLPGAMAGRLEVEAAVFVGGWLHLVAEHTSVHGALILGDGAVVLGRERDALTATGSLRLDIEREGQPGFLGSGNARPGRVRPVAAPD